MLSKLAGTIDDAELQGHVCRPVVDRYARADPKPSEDRTSLSTVASNVSLP
jgi:hypothetical protein